MTMSAIHRVTHAVKFCGLLLSISVALGATTGPSAPEVGAFTPIEAGQLVDPATGQLSYNLPVIHVPGSGGGYSMSLGYQSGILLEQEASWVGLGWTLQPGAITRAVVGFPDDFNGTQELVEQSLNTVADLTLTVGFRHNEYGGISGMYGFLSGDSRIGLLIPRLSPSIDKSGKLIGVSRDRYKPRNKEDEGNVIMREIALYTSAQSDPRAPAVGYSGGGRSYGFGVQLGATMAFMQNVLESVGLSEDFSATVGPIGYFNIRVSNKNKHVVGAWHVSDAGLSGMAMDVVQERDGVHDKDISGDWRARRTAKHEGMIHLGQDLFQVTSAGLTGSMRVVYDTPIQIRGLDGEDSSIERSINVDFTNVRNLLEDLPNLMANISVSGVYNKYNYDTAENVAVPRFAFSGDERGQTYRIQPTLSGVGLFSVFEITDPMGDRYTFNEALLNHSMQSWSSSEPYGIGKEATTHFTDLFREDGAYSMGFNRNNNDYAYTWKLGRLERRDGSWVNLHYGTPVENFVWRSPLVGTGPVGSITETNRAQVSYGVKDLNYLKLIETDTHMGCFLVEERQDGLTIAEAGNEEGFASGYQAGDGDARQHLLKHFILIEKLDGDESNTELAAALETLRSGSPTLELLQAEPLRSRVRQQIEFEYTYALCPGVPNSIGPNAPGKLTLSELHLRRNMAPPGETTAVEVYQFFYYGDDKDNSLRNYYPYNGLNFDRWGYFNNPGDLVRPYYRHVAIGLPIESEVPQSAAWSLREVVTPLGAKLRIQYEQGAYSYSGENEDLQGEVMGGAPRVRSIDVRDGAGTVLEGRSYQYDDGAVLREPRGYVNEDLEDGGSRQDLQNPDDFGSYWQAWGYSSAAPDFGLLRRSLMQNGNFCLPGPSVVYGNVREFSNPDRDPTTNGFTEHRFATAKYLANPVDIHASYIDHEEFPAFLHYFQYIALWVRGKGICFKIRVLGYKKTICLLFKHSANYHLNPLNPPFPNPLCFVHGQPLDWLCFGESKGEANKIFGPAGARLDALLEIAWDVRNYTYEYDMVDHTRLIGAPLATHIYNAENQFLKTEEYLYNVEGDAETGYRLLDQAPEVLQYHATSPVIGSASVGFPEEVRQSGNAFRMGLAVALAVSPPSIAPEIDLQLIIDKDIKTIARKTTLPLLSFGRVTREFNVPFLDGGMAVTESHILAFDPVTRQGTLMERSSPTDSDNHVYEMNIPAFRLDPTLETAHIFNEVGQRITGVEREGTFTPLQATRSKWEPLPLGDVEPIVMVPYPVLQQVWNGGGAVHALTEPDNKAAWSDLERVQALDDQGVPVEFTDPHGTVSSILRDANGRVKLVAVNSARNDIYWESYDQSANHGVAGAYHEINNNESAWYLSFGEVTSIPVQPGKAYALDFIMRSNKFSKEGQQLIVNGHLIAMLPLTPAWTAFHVVMPPLGGANPTMNIQLVKNPDLDPYVDIPVDIDEVRMYPADALVTSYVYRDSQSAPVAIMDENAQLTLYETTPREELKSVHNMRRELLQLHYSRKQNELWQEN